MSSEQPGGSATVRYRFPRELRLRTSREFARVFARGVRSTDALFNVVASPNELGHPRLGLAVSRKAARAATERNRLKRMIREEFRLGRHALPALDVIVVARPGASERPADNVRESLRRHWRRITELCAS